MDLKKTESEDLVSVLEELLDNMTRNEAIHTRHKDT